MKKYLFVELFILFLAAACHPAPSRKAKQLADQLNEVVQTSSPPELPTSENGYFMKALINGKPWSAKIMLKFDRETNDYRIMGTDGATIISFNIHLYEVHPGTVRNFGTSFTADLSTENAIELWTGKKGQVKITKVAGKVVAGIFHFTATTPQHPNKKIQVENGYFRVILQ